MGNDGLGAIGKLINLHRSDSASHWCPYLFVPVPLLRKAGIDRKKSTEF